MSIMYFMEYPLFNVAEPESVVRFTLMVPSTGFICFGIKFMHLFFWASSINFVTESISYFVKFNKIMFPVMVRADNAYPIFNGTLFNAFRSVLPLRLHSSSGVASILVYVGAFSMVCNTLPFFVWKVKGHCRSS